MHYMTYFDPYPSTHSLETGHISTIDILPNAFNIVSSPRSPTLEPLRTPMSTADSPSSSFVRHRAGNNIYGAAGTRKCFLCRSRKAKCEYDRDNPDETCRYCRERSLTCGSKLNAQEFSRQGRRKRRCTRDLSTSYKNYTWQQVEKGKLSDLVMFVESRCPGKSLEDNLAIAVELVSQLQCSEGNLTAEAALNKSVKFLEESTVVPVSMCHSFSLSQEWAVAADTSSNPPYCLGI